MELFYRTTMVDNYKIKLINNKKLIIIMVV